jgi:hypothetical protein
MARGRKTGGRKPGTPNKATVERKERGAREIAGLEAIERARKEMLAAEIEKATGRPPATGKEVLINLVTAYMGLAAFYQPTAPLKRDPVTKEVTSANTNYDEAMFRHYSAMAKEAAAALTPFQHPRYSAVVVGASVVTKVHVTGGMPNDFEPPASGEVIDLKPGTIITADD